MIDLASVGLIGQKGESAVSLRNYAIDEKLVSRHPSINNSAKSSRSSVEHSRIPRHTYATTISGNDRIKRMKSKWRKSVIAA